ncbi:MAG: hypothetical protein ACLQDY_22455 [Streptosporangiaceae bacterium]
MSVEHSPDVRVLEDPLTNKGTAFTEEERSELGLRGLLPAVVETLEQQARRTRPSTAPDPATSPDRLTLASCRR